MSNKILPLRFWQQPTLTIARELLGKVLVRRIDGQKLCYRIVETEAYIGEADLACHASPVRNRLVRGSKNQAKQIISNGASRGKTNRTAAMFGPPKQIYVYLIYGMYYCLNFVTGKVGSGEAVLIRAVEPLHRKFISSTNGPGKLCRALKIDKKLNNQKIDQKSGLWVTDDGFRISRANIGKSARRGVAYAKECADYPWRFFIKTSLFVS